jgi:ABC-2 type transport system permease protein
MNNFSAALWAEALKARRSGAPLLTVGLFSLFPLVSGLFMIIIRDPLAAQSMGVISMKAQVVAGDADWATFFNIIFQALALGGYILFAFITTWIFGREYANRTIKDLLALPTPRSTIVAGKFFLFALWVFALTLLVYLVGLVVGFTIALPGWSAELAFSSLGTLLGISSLNLLLMPFVAFFAGVGRGYLPSLGWAFLSFITAQIISVLGWGGWFPWSLPVLLSGMFGPQGAEQLGTHSYILVLIACIAAIGGTMIWWLRADQTT